MTATAERRDRQQLNIMPLTECFECIDSAPLGRIGFSHKGHQLILPVNHVRNGLHVAFRTADGAKADAARGASEVAFEADGYDQDTRTGWSVLGIGRATIADDILATHLDASGLAPWADRVARDHWVVIKLRHVTGRRIGPAPSSVDHPADFPVSRLDPEGSCT